MGSGIYEPVQSFDSATNRTTDLQSGSIIPALEFGVETFQNSPRTSRLSRDIEKVHLKAKWIDLCNCFIISFFYK